MLYFSKLRIVFIVLISLFFIIIASSNFLKVNNNLLDKKINLGLDLQGGSYLLLEIDNTPVIEQRLQNTTSLIRSYFKDKKIREGTCGYGIDGKIGEEPAGPNLMKKIKKISKDKEKKKILK